MSKVFASCRLALFLLALCLIFPAYSFYLEEEAVIKQASLTNQPIVALFLGKDEGPWAQKIEQDLLSSQLFHEGVESIACLWILSTNRTKDLTKIEERYAIENVPSILLLDPQGKEFARLDYDASSVSVILEKMQGLIEDFHEICRSLDKGLMHCDEAQLQILYNKSMCLSLPYFKQLILHQGIQKEKGTFFHLEKYALLLGKKKLKDLEVVKFKKKILARDPKNQGPHCLSSRD